MTARGYEFYLRVFNLISEISSRTQEDKIHIHKRASNILFVT